MRGEGQAGRAAARTLIARNAVTAKGNTHQAAMPPCTSSAVTINAATTAAATRQSSPITKSYQKSPKFTIYCTVVVNLSDRARGLQVCTTGLGEQAHQAK